MDLPQKRSRFSEDKLKVVQDIYKRNQSNPMAPGGMKMPPPAQNFYMYQMPPQWPYPYAAPPMVPAPPLPQPPAQKPTASKLCTDSLKNFITKAFSKCQSDEERDYMEKQIKEIIQTAKNNNKFHLQDWNNTELPLLPREIIVMQMNSLPVQIQQPQVSRRKTRFQPVEIHDDPKPKKREKIEKIEKIEKSKSDNLESDWKIAGTCTDLEKQYFRLTSKPDPSTVRPEPILRKALAWFKDRWRRKEIKYEYFSDQLRSIRQDLTVQGIKDKFTVEVYQVHTRLALEAGDLDQCISCMSRLFELYDEGLSGKQAEFTAYRIIYFSLQQLYIQLEKCLKKLSVADKETEEIKHALALKSSLIHGNYHQVFRLRKIAPNMGAYMIDMFLQKLRKFSLLKIFKSYMPNVPLDFVSQELGFLNSLEAETFIKECGGVINAGIIETKESLAALNSNLG
ncbi:unnamed protein product [Blepharisma stoltei]|uniref:PCI domain-containing protein n=1 Tax=Blepharisma stoltei TaxID=1481888 RepID=A0AAU9INU7_9CILI|nr:unnamed protein product [Blepharisma stoltei]